MIKNKKAQMIIEYAVMFAAIVAVILIAGNTFFRPALTSFFNKAAQTVSNAANQI